MTRYHPPDVALALEYLCGELVEDERGRISHKFHAPGSAEETRSRDALVKLLRGPGELHRAIRFMLAELIDLENPQEERIFTIANRQSGPQPHHFLMVAIATFILLETAGGRKIESVKQAATNLFDVSMSTVDRAWANHKDILTDIAESPGRTIN